MSVQLRAMRLLMAAILEAVPANQFGVPEGPIYAVVMSHGCSLPAFQGAVSVLVRAQALTRTANVLRRGPGYVSIRSALTEMEVA